MARDVKIIMRTQWRPCNHLQWIIMKFDPKILETLSLQTTLVEVCCYVMGVAAIFETYKIHWVPGFFTLNFSESNTPLGWSLIKY